MLVHNHYTIMHNNFTIIWSILYDVLYASIILNKYSFGTEEVFINQRFSRPRDTVLNLTKA